MEFIARFAFFTFYLHILPYTSGQTQSEAILQYQIQEGLPTDSIVGNILQDSKLDQEYNAEELGQLEFYMGGQVNQDFGIGKKDGILKTLKAVDRDVVCANMAQCLVKLEITVEPYKYYRKIQVHVLIDDKNDNIPTFPEPRITRSISEASAPETAIPLPTAVDPDSPQFAVKRYEMTKGQPTFELQVKNNTLTDGTIDVLLVLKQSLDREVTDAYQVQVLAIDGGSIPQTGTLDISIEVTDINDHNPVFDNSTYEVTVSESAAIDSSIVKVHATDPDSGANGEIVYSFGKETMDEFGNIFKLDSESGLVSVSGVLDYERYPVYKLVVEAKDKSPDSIAASCRVIVNVKDTNDNAPKITVNVRTSSGFPEVAENAPIDESVALITVSDPDGGKSGEFNCSIQSEFFNLEKIYPTEFRITTKVSFNRETKEYYEVTIECQDHGDSPLPAVKTVNVKILDVNDNSPEFSKASYSVPVTENNKINQTIVTVKAADKDTGGNAALLYSFDPSANSKFRIDPMTGEITAKVRLDHEQNEKHELTVVASDQGKPAKSSTAKVIVTVIDVDDEPPRFLKDRYNLGVYEKEVVNTEVGRVQAEDADSDPYNKFTFSIQQDTELPFKIDADSGRIYTRQELDREQTAVYHLIVVATNTLGPRLSSSVSVSVYVADKNDNPPIVDFPNPYNDTLYLSTHTPKGRVVGKIVAHDDDVGTNAQLSYFIEDPARKEFIVDEHTGHIIVNKDLREHGDKVFEIRLLVKDNGIKPNVAEATLNLVVNKSVNFPHADASKNPNHNFNIVITIIVVSTVIVIILLAAIILLMCRNSSSKAKQNAPTKYNAVARMADRNQLVSKTATKGGTNPVVQDNYAYDTKELPRGASKSRGGGQYSLDVAKSSGLPKQHSHAHEFEQGYGNRPPSYSSNSSGYQSNYHPTAPKPKQKIIYESEHKIHKPRPISPAQFQPRPGAVEGDRGDSDSACSADLSNADSGRGSNDDGSDGHTRSPNSGQQRQSNVQPSRTPQSRPEMQTQGLPTGVHRHPSHHAQNPTYAPHAQRKLPFSERDTHPESIYPQRPSVQDYQRSRPSDYYSHKNIQRSVDNMLWNLDEETDKFNSSSV